MPVRFALLLAGIVAAQAAEFHVATSGKDSNRGTRSSPFASLDQARAALRSLKQSSGLPPDGVTIWIHEGDYALASAFELGPEDGGEGDRPVTYRAVEGKEVKLIGGRSLPAKAFVPVTAAATVPRLDVSGRSQVKRADLRALGITNYGTFPDQLSGAASMPELFFNDGRMILARWPNEGWAEFSKVIESGPAPWRHHASDNLIVNCGRVQTGNWDVTHSWVTDQDPGFRDPDGLDFRLRADAAAFVKIPGFERIPFEQIGLQPQRIAAAK